MLLGISNRWFFFWFFQGVVILFKLIFFLVERPIPILTCNMKGNAVEPFGDIGLTIELKNLDKLSGELSPEQ